MDRADFSPIARWFFETAESCHPHQAQPGGDWVIWMMRGGRGSGKTHGGARFAHRQAWLHPQTPGLLVGATGPDIRATMIEGPAGLQSVYPPGFRPRFEPSKRLLTWPNGARALCISADEPERLRGPQHGWFWADDLAAWKGKRARKSAEQPPAKQAWDNILFGFRVGDDLRACVTTTPKPYRWLRDIESLPGAVVTVGSTNVNRANLAPAFLSLVVAPFEGTRLGRQELDAEYLMDVPGALWQLEHIMYGTFGEVQPDARGIGVDPALTSGPDSDETGIVAGARVGKTCYITHDWSGRYSPAAMGARVRMLQVELGGCPVYVERNAGGDHLIKTLTDAGVTNVKPIAATASKEARTQPVAAMYERTADPSKPDEVLHCERFPMLEEQMTTWVPGEGDSPDHVDALVHLVRGIMRTAGSTAGASLFSGSIR